MRLPFLISTRHPIRRVLCLVLIFAVLLPAGFASAEDYGVVQGGRLNLRAGPSYSAALLGSYPTGTWVEVLEKGTQWHRVKIGDTIGYMDAAYVSFENVTEIIDAQVSGATGYINLRSAPSPDAPVLGQYSNGTKVTILSHQNGWYHVNVGNQSGYMVDYLVQLSQSVVSTYAAVQSQHGGSVNIRQSPTTQSRILTSVRPGQQVKVLVKGSSWHKVQYGNIQGYMSAQYLAIGGSGSGTPVPGLPVGTAVVNNPISTQVLMMRKSPSQSAEVLGYYHNGKQVDVLENQGTWTWVRVDGLTGYMMTRYLNFNTGSTLPSPVPATVYNPNGGSYVNLRAEPGLNTRIISTVPVGTVVTVVSKTQDWTMVRIGETTGYISSYFLRY